MEALDFKTALAYLKSGIVLTDRQRKTYFSLSSKGIVHSFNGNRFILSIEDFYALYGKEEFYVYEAPSGIDEQKDLEYYAFKHK